MIHKKETRKERGVTGRGKDRMISLEISCTQPLFCSQNMPSFALSYDFEKKKNSFFAANSFFVDKEAAKKIRTKFSMQIIVNEGRKVAKKCLVS